MGSPFFYFWKPHSFQDTYLNEKPRCKKGQVAVLSVESVVIGVEWKMIQVEKSEKRQKKKQMLCKPQTINNQELILRSKRTPVYQRDINLIVAIQIYHFLPQKIRAEIHHHISHTHIRNWWLLIEGFVLSVHLDPSAGWFKNSREGKRSFSSPFATINRTNLNL